MPETKDDICDPTHGDIYYCNNSGCKRYIKAVIVHRCETHTPLKKDRRCDNCGGEMAKGHPTAFSR